MADDLGRRRLLRDLDATRARLAAVAALPYERPPIICHPDHAPAVEAMLRGRPVGVPAPELPSRSDPAVLDDVYLAAMFAEPPRAALAPIIELEGRRG